MKSLNDNNLKIAYIVGEFPSISETFILNQIIWFINRGYKVDIYSLKKSVSDKAHQAVYEYSLSDITRYFPEIPKNIPYRILKGLYLFVKNFYKSPVTILKSVNIFSFKREIISLSVLYSVIPFLGKEYDIIHAHFGNNGLVGANLKTVGIGGKLITTFHGYDMSTFLKEKGDDIYNNLFKISCLCLPISNYWRKKLLEIGCDKNRIIIQHIGININDFKIRNKTKSDNFRILTIGRFVEKKGMEYSIKAVTELLDIYDNIVYTIVGSGYLKNKLKNANTSDRIIFKDNLNEEEIKDIFSKTDLFVLHSITASDGDMEGVPVVLMEAMAFEIPVVSTFHSGIPELVRHGESGFLVEEKDVNDMRDRIEYLYKNEDVRNKMGKNGREIIIREFNLDKQGENLEKIFKGVLNKKK